MKKLFICGVMSLFVSINSMYKKDIDFLNKDKNYVEYDLQVLIHSNIDLSENFKRALDINKYNENDSNSIRKTKEMNILSLISTSNKYQDLNRVEELQNQLKNNGYVLVYGKNGEFALQHFSIE